MSSLGLLSWKVDFKKPREVGRWFRDVSGKHMSSFFVFSRGGWVGVLKEVLGFNWKKGGSFCPLREGTEEHIWQLWVDDVPIPMVGSLHSYPGGFSWSSFFKVELRRISRWIPIQCGLTRVNFLTLHCTAWFFSGRKLACNLLKKLQIHIMYCIQ